MRLSPSSLFTNLLWRILRLHSQYAAISVLQRQLPIELILKCMANEKYPTSLRACFCRYGRVCGLHTRASAPLTLVAPNDLRLMLNIHINCDPFESIPAVRFARLWSNIGTTLSTEGASPSVGPRRCGTEPRFSGPNPCFELFRALSFACAGYTVQSFADAASEQRAEFAGVKQFIDGHLRRTELACRAYNDNAYNTLTLEVIVMTWYLVRFGFFHFQELLRLSDVLLAILDSRHISRHGKRRGADTGNGQC